METTKSPENQSQTEDTNKAENQTQETNNNKNQTEGNDSNGSLIRRTITGSLLGATIGYLATPENGKKLKESISADALKSTGSNLGQTVKEKSKKAAESIKDSASKLFKKEDVSIDGYSNEADENSENETMLDSYNEKNTDKNSRNSSSADNKNVNERLDRLEEMLSQLLEDEGCQEKTSGKSNSNE